MNVYDFDKTIFYPDSSATFIKYCLKKYPVKVLPSLICALPSAIKYFFDGRNNASELKERLFSFLCRLDSVDDTVSLFWKGNFHRIGNWYLLQRADDDIVISASPEFLVKPVADKLGFALIGTKMDKKTGVIDGENCHDKEKIIRFYEQYPDITPDAFYSDSFSDTPMAEISRKAFMVHRGEVRPWPEK